MTGGVIMAYNASDFLTKHVIAAYAAIKSIPVINGVEKDTEALFQKVVVDTLALPDDKVFYAAYIKVDGKQAYPEVTSAESGVVSTLRVESRPDGIGLTTLESSGGGLAPMPCAWKHEISGLYVVSHRLTTVVVPAGGWVGLVAQQGSQNLWGFSIDGIPAAMQFTSGGSTAPTWTAYRIDDSGVVFSDDLGGNAGNPVLPGKGIYLLNQTNFAYKYLVIKAPDTSELTIITVNEVAQVVEVTS